MSTSTPMSQAAIASAPGRLIARYPLIAFFVIAFAGAWIVFLIIALLHAASNGTAIALIPRLFPVTPPGAALLTLGLMLIVFPALIIILTRGRLSYKDHQAQAAGAPQTEEMPLTNA